MAKLCTVCGEAASKYKCPNCEAGYCSVGCFRIHKSEPCVSSADRRAAAQSSSVKTEQQHESSHNSNIEEEEDDEEEKLHRLTLEDLKKLDNSVPVKKMLTDPRLRTLLEAVRQDSNPIQSIRVHRQRSDFEQLVQAMLDATSGHS
ncbi:Zinc finger HIT domain-containing protein 3 [Coemansia sp. RSA 1365]|nr:Zinc finger HIT domain-containing protein 3 [Coemansia sp. RSA 1365]